MLPYLPVPDFHPTRGWLTPADAAARSRWCCEQLEESRVLYCEGLPFNLSEPERQLLLSQSLDGSRLHKNISYRPAQDMLRGGDGKDTQARTRMHQFMRRYSGEVTRCLSQLLSPYTPHWTLDYASFRPEAEQDRKLPLRKRNDLLHVDAFPSRPTRGGRILRCFSNVNPSQPRVWLTTDAFPGLASRYAQEAGLVAIAHRGAPPGARLVHALKRAFGAKTQAQSAYDKFMLRFHDYLKENADFQQNCPKTQLEFPPNSTWLCYTDAVPHAVTHGQYALEQTFIVPLIAMLNPQKSPLRILEALAGTQLVPSQAESLAVNG
jgi:hypothetical protein